MKDLKVFAVVDKVSKFPCSVFVSDTPEAAERSFFTLLTGTIENVFTIYPEQFDLYHVANLSYENGRLNVVKPGSEVLVETRFNVDHFDLSEPIVSGSSYDKAFLKFKRDELIEYFNSARAQEEEVVDNEN